MGIRVIKDLIEYKVKFGSAFEKELQRVIELNEKSEEEILQLKNIEFVKQFQNAFQNSRYYSELYKKHGLKINSVKDLNDAWKIPIITKSDVKNYAADMLTKSRFTVFKAYTSGTTGTPLAVYRDFASTIKENAYSQYFSIMHGYKLGEPMVSLRGTLDRNTFSYYDKINNVLYLSSFHINPERIGEYYKIIKDFQPKAIKAYPSSMHILATELYKAGKELNIPLALSSSEILHDFQRDIIERVLNTTIYDWYGNAERSVAFGQYKDFFYKEFPLYSHTEVEDGHMITTGFINSSFPLIRYKVDDVLKLADQNDKTGIIQKIEGRNDDYILLKNGERIGRLDLAFKRIKHILAVQIVQKQVGRVIVNLVHDKDFSESDQVEIEKNLRNLLGHECLILFEKIEVNQLIRSSKGKFNLVVSQI